MTYSIKRIRIDYPNAYKAWLPEEEIALQSAVMDGKPVEEISRQLLRQKGAIRSRIRKMGLVPTRDTPVEKDGPFEELPDKIDFLSAGYKTDNDTNISLRLSWKPVLSNDAERYLFPQPITGFMLDHFRGPAIYRWKVIDGDEHHVMALYIGSTKNLCPDRIAGYLDPKDSKTNQRLNQAFHAYKQQGCTITLDILKAGSITNSGLFTLPIHQESSRLFLEGLIIHHYRYAGQQLLNLREKADHE